ncbi:MAG: hypothetical protein ACRDNG_12620, partial [Gaiellaceae bacterium]
WNIREFGGLTPKWDSTQADTPKRDLLALACIRDAVGRFDMVAIQEAQKRLAALRELLLGLGRDWAVIPTDPVEDDKGDDERLAFVFDRSRVAVDGLACELVVPYSWSKAKRPKTGVPAGALDRQFARTPYAVSFKRRSAIFTLHVYWGSTSAQDVAERVRELSSIASWLKAWARDPGHLGSEPDLSGGLQHRPKRLGAVAGLHVDQPHDPDRAAEPQPPGRRPPAGALLRPDRLVHRGGRRLKAPAFA